MYPLNQTLNTPRTAPPRQRPVTGGGGNPGNAARVAAVMQGRTYTPQQPLPMDAGPSRVRSLADDYQRQINKANRANESRYQDILGQYNQREQDALKQANLVRDQRYRDESARIQNDLTSRGLANSSLLGKDLFQSYERNAQYPLAVQLQTSGDKLGFMERRNDVGPDPAMLLQLAAQQGQTDQFQNQNLQQTVGEIGQAVDQRVAQQNAPQPNRMVNIPVMMDPIFAGPMGMGGYPQQQMQGQQQQQQMTPQQMYYMQQMMKQQGQQQQFNPNNGIQVGWRPDEPQAAQPGLSAGQMANANYRDRKAAERRAAALREAEYIKQRQKTDAMMNYPWFMQMTGSGASSGAAPAATAPAATSSSSYPQYPQGYPIPPSRYNQIPPDSPYWWWNDPNYWLQALPGVS